MVSLIHVRILFRTHAANCHEAMRIKRMPCRVGKHTIRNLCHFLSLTKTGACAAMSHWWFKNEPPNAPWKKSSAIA